MKKVFFCFLTMVLAVGSLSLASCSDDDEPDKTEIPSGATDVLSNTSWQGKVDGIQVTLIFKTDGKASEKALGSTSNGTYTVSGNNLTWNVDESILRDSYGPRYKFTKSSNRLVLKNDLNEELTFTLL